MQRKLQNVRLFKIILNFLPQSRPGNAVCQCSFLYCNRIYIYIYWVRTFYCGRGKKGPPGPVHTLTHRPTYTTQTRIHTRTVQYRGQVSREARKGFEKKYSMKIPVTVQYMYCTYIRGIIIHKQYVIK